jgi:predicted Rossmann fold flavoprotein
VTSDSGDCHFDIAIVGAGAAGLAAAILVRRLNPSRSVVLLDSSAKPGAKILVSGGSRCNVTNVAVSERDFNGGKPAIIRRILKAFPPGDVVAWFASLGVPLHEEALGKLFPDSNRSRDVLDALLRESASSGVVFQTATRVEGVTAGLALHTTRGQIRATNVVMATGGLSLPKTGSDGGGLEIARRLGHTIVPTTPALVPLTSAADRSLHETLSGVSHDVELALWIDGRVALRLRGSLLWTHVGVSGPVVLDMSRHWLRALLDERTAHMTLTFLPGQSFDSVDRDLASQDAARRRASVHGRLADVLPASLATTILQRLALESTRPVAELPRVDRRRLARALVEWPLNIDGNRGYNYAEATAGGVALDEIDPATMSSRKCPGLYLVGEMLDVDGRIGGFNFQWAWSSAMVAARALASSGGGQLKVKS